MTGSENNICFICDKPCPDYKPKLCCKDTECPCGGVALWPPICSNKCSEELFGKPDDLKAP